MVRVSKDERLQELGATAQRHAIEEWAARNQIHIVTWIMEEMSGAAELDDRPRLLEAVARVESLGAGWLVFHRIDRFARNTTTAVLVQTALARVGAAIATADGVGNGDDPASRLVRGILLEVAAFEREFIRARIKAALDVKKQRGELTGHAPIGFRVVPGTPADPQRRLYAPRDAPRTRSQGARGDRRGKAPLRGAGQYAPRDQGARRKGV